MIAVRDYADFVRREYLEEFVARGGSAVKFVVVPGDADAGALSVALAGAADSEGFSSARVDAARVRMHMIDKVFHDVARQIDWDAAARAYVVGALRELAFGDHEEDGVLELDAIAAGNDYDPGELRKTFNRKLQREILDHGELAQEFAIGMLRLCAAQVERDEQTQAEREAVLQWLRGELRLMSALKPARIYGRIARHNARDMLASLTRWLALTGRKGLVLELDIRRTAVQRRGDDDDGVLYTKATAVDVYEVLRQLIDSTDELSHCFVCVVASPEVLYDPKRGIEEHYHALKMRIWNEVRDRLRPNPLAALVDVDGSADER